MTLFLRSTGTRTGTRTGGPRVDLLLVRSRCGLEERWNVAGTPNDAHDFDVAPARAVENDERASGERTKVGSEFGAKPPNVSMESEQLALFVDRIDEAIRRSEALRLGYVLGKIINVGIGGGGETESIHFVPRRVFARTLLRRRRFAATGSNATLSPRSS